MEKWNRNENGGKRSSGCFQDALKSSVVPEPQGTAVVCAHARGNFHIFSIIAFHCKFLTTLKFEPINNLFSISGM